MVAIVALKTSGLIEMFWGENCGKMWKLCNILVDPHLGSLGGQGGAGVHPGAVPRHLVRRRRGVPRHVRGADCRPHRSTCAPACHAWCARGGRPQVGLDVRRCVAVRLLAVDFAGDRWPLSTQANWQACCMNKILISCFYPVIVHYSAYQAHSSTATSAQQLNSFTHTKSSSDSLLTCRLCCPRESCRGRMSLRGCRELRHMLAPAGALAGAGHTERPLRVHQVRWGTCSLRLLELPPAHRTHFAQSMSSSWPILLRVASLGKLPDVDHCTICPTNT